MMAIGQTVANSNLTVFKMAAVRRPVFMRWRCGTVSVRPSVRPPQAGIVSKRLDGSSSFST